jgi:O-acetylserine/cysteine efflux transporter
MSISHLLLAVMVTAIWGLSFSSIKLGVGSVDPFILAAFRFVFAVFPVIFFVPKPDVSLKWAALYGLTFGCGVWGCVNLGVQLGVSAGVASLVLQLSAFISVILGYFFLQESITRYKLLGFAVSLFGLSLILRVTDGSISTIGILTVLAGAFFWALSNIIIKKSGVKKVFSFLVWGSLFTPIPLFLMGYFSGGTEAYAQLVSGLDGWVVGAVLFQAYIATLFGFVFWNYLLSLYPMSSVAPLSLLAPVWGFLASSVFFGETIGSDKLIASALIMLGLFISLFGDRFFLHR